MNASTRHQHADYLPGMGRDWLLPLYDPFQRLLGVPSIHRQLVDLADIHPDHRVLEIGCGTGNLTTLVSRRYPTAKVVGLDPDPRALARARKKASSVQLDRGFAEELPYSDASFDRVLSAFMFHHLEPDAKRETLREALRVLKPGGALVLADIGGAIEPSDGMMARMGHRNPRLQDNLGDRIPTLMLEVGFESATELAHRVSRIMGRVTFVHAVAPADASQIS